MTDLNEALRQALSQVTVRAWRLHLDTPGVFAHVPMLRGVWGAALRRRDGTIYDALFEGGPSQTPRYILRPAPRSAAPAPAVEFLLFGATEAEERMAWEAWDEALSMGLGPKRCPARLLEARPLAWDMTPLNPTRIQPGFGLAPLPWPCGEITAPCRLVFGEPLRLIRDGRLIQVPTLADLTLAALRRLLALVGPAADEIWRWRATWLEVARQQPASGWTGRPLDLVRYSGRQQRELEVNGVSGELALPQGPGPLSDLLSAARWFHLGKATVMGLGHLTVLPGLDEESDEPGRERNLHAE